MRIRSHGDYVDRTRALWCLHIHGMLFIHLCFEKQTACHLTTEADMLGRMKGMSNKHYDETSSVDYGIRSKDSSLWYRVIKAMFGDGGALDNTGKFARSSTWTTIVRECGNLSSKGLPRGSLGRKSNSPTNSSKS
ncbi:hypothetical protein Tco_0078209 [Tanacetum coccineum]